MSSNGANGHLNGVIVRRLTFDSGVEGDVIPLSPHAVVKIRQKAEELYPFPDKAAFIKPLPNSAIEGDTYFDKDDPEYKHLYREAAQLQAAYILRAICDVCLTFPRGREQLIEDFRPHLDKQRIYIDLPEDEWEATLYYGIIASPADQETVSMAAMSALPISMEEVIEGEHGLRVFRYKVQGRRPSSMVAGWKTLASSLDKGPKNQS